MALTLDPVQSSHATVLDALRDAAVSSGVDFDYLVTTARRESGLNPAAESKTSSATGLFQFVKQTWLATLKEHGAEHGYGAFADAIGKDASGRYFVSDPARGAEIFALRRDPAAAAAMAAELTKETSDILQSRLGRAPSKGELYAAHVLGAGGATKLIALAQSNPTTAAQSCFPEAAASNHNLFRTPGGEPVTVAALLDRLSNGHGTEACEMPARFAHNLPRDTGAPEALPQAKVWQSVLSSPPPVPESAGQFQPTSFPTGLRPRFGYGGIPLTLTPQLLTLLAAINPAKLTADDRT